MTEIENNHYMKKQIYQPMLLTIRLSKKKKKKKKNTIPSQRYRKHVQSLSSEKNKQRKNKENLTSEKNTLSLSSERRVRDDGLGRISVGRIPMGDGLFPMRIEGNDSTRIVDSSMIPKDENRKDGKDENQETQLRISKADFKPLKLKTMGFVKKPKMPKPTKNVEVIQPKSSVPMSVFRSDSARFSNTRKTIDSGAYHIKDNFISQCRRPYSAALPKSKRFLAPKTYTSKHCYGQKLSCYNSRCARLGRSSRFHNLQESERKRISILNKRRRDLESKWNELEITAGRSDIDKILEMEYRNQEEDRKINNLLKEFQSLEEELQRCDNQLHQVKTRNMDFFEKDLRVFER